MKIKYEDIKELYSNKIGVTFLWETKDKGHLHYNKINIVFNNTALHFDRDELELFLQNIEKSLLRPEYCNKNLPRQSKSMLLDTPLRQLSFAMSYNDLSLMKDLIQKTLFEIDFLNILKALN